MKNRQIRCNYERKLLFMNKKTPNKNRAREVSIMKEDVIELDGDYQKELKDDIIKAMTQMYQACSIDNDQPDIIITTPVLYSAYETALQANKRWEGNATDGDAGFQSLRFKGASVYADSHCPDGHMYFLNSRYLDFKVHSKRNFAFEDFRPMEVKDGIQARIFWMGQLTTSNPRMHGMLVGGATAY